MTHFDCNFEDNFEKIKGNFGKELEPKRVAHFELDFNRIMIKVYHFKSL